MAKTKNRSVHKCTTCGEEQAQWAGRCPGCGDWNTMIEMAPITDIGATGRAVRTVVPVSLATTAANPKAVHATGVTELDRVLGGGITMGSVSLLGGEPGIGKSTLILQLCSAIAQRGGKCLIATGEESADQVARRAERLGANHENILLIAESEVEVVLATAEQMKPRLLIIDSVQTMTVSAQSASAGTVTQVRESAAAITAYAKANNVATVLVGHVTKEGNLAGPRVLEHMVDTVIEFEGDRHSTLRFLRTVKHRFGATDEVGVLDMTEGGLESITDASKLFLEDRQVDVAGSVVVPTLHGRRPMLVEIQGLIVEGQFARRYAQGLDSNRLNMIIAVLQAQKLVALEKHDVYASVVGGLRLDDPGTDLAVALAIVSMRKEVAPANDLVAIGEIGLSGEIRKASHARKRLAEAQRMGFERAIVPESIKEGPDGLELIPVKKLVEAVSVLTGKTARRPTKSRSV